MNNNVRANSNNGFLQKFLLIAIVCIAFGFWFLYDAMIKYPDNVKHAAAFESIQAEDISDDAKKEKWEAVAKENGWSHSHPEHTAKEWQEKIYYFQYPCSLLGFLVGIPVLINYFRTRNSWIESDGKGLKTSWGKSVDFGKLSKISKQKWETKGIAKLEFELNGSIQKFVLDDFKYDREATGVILGYAESIAGHEAIVGGRSQIEIEKAIEQKLLDMEKDAAENSNKPVDDLE